MKDTRRIILIALTILLVVIIVYITNIVLFTFHNFNNSSISDESYNLEETKHKMSQQQIQAFNSIFANYEGIYRGELVKHFLLLVLANNEKFGSEGMTIRVTFLGKTYDEQNDIIEMYAKISTNNKYRIELIYDDISGIIDEAIITEAEDYMEFNYDFENYEGNKTRLTSKKTLINNCKK